MTRNVLKLTETDIKHERMIKNRTGVLYLKAKTFFWVKKPSRNGPVTKRVVA